MSQTPIYKIFSVICMKIQIEWIPDHDVDALKVFSCITYITKKDKGDMERGHEKGEGVSK